MRRSSPATQDDAHPAITKAIVPAAGRGTRLMPATRAGLCFGSPPPRRSGPRGQADAVATGEHFAGGQPVVVALGDSILVSHAKKSVLARMMATHAKHRPAATIAVEAVPHEAVSRYGIVAPKGATDSVFPIRGFVEKPSPSKAPSNFAAAGRYMLA